MTPIASLPRVALAALLLGAVLPALAQESTGPAPAGSSVAPLGAESQAWVQLQQSGSAASGEARPLPGEIADHIYQRYADSFKQPIPAEFKRQSTGSADDGSGQ